MKLLFFSADWCGVCHAKAPVAREIARAMKLPLEVIGFEEEGGRARAEELRIRTVPTLALVDGARVPFRLVGRLISLENAAHLAALAGYPRHPGVGA
jgi:thioredoxin 1